MACVENIPPLNGDSEMEEGEIVDDLSDISSEEEFLLRQRLQVLENYNNVLERKKAKRFTIDAGTKSRKQDALLQELSEISATELDDYNSPQQKKVQRHVKSHKQKRRREEPNELIKAKEKKKNYRTKRKIGVKIISESSEESEDEYRNRRRKLADAVLVNTKSTNDKTSLSERLQKMLCGVNTEPTKLIIPESKTNIQLEDSENQIISPVKLKEDVFKQIETLPEETSQELIDLCTDEDSKVNMQLEDSVDTVDSVIKTIEMQDADEANSNATEEIKCDKDSDEDIELLRQHALKTKSIKEKQIDLLTLSENKSEDEDSDTAELRLICLKSALLKKAIEMKQKQKLRKRLSQSCNLNDELLEEAELFPNAEQLENNTDTESVDMDIVSDAEDKDKDAGKLIEEIPEPRQETNVMMQHQDELEDDEDLLRAKLLTSLSKNLPKLVDPKLMKTVEVKDTGQVNKEKVVIPEEKRFIINLGESDSEGEHEATKNLTKMHIKLSEQVDFQQKLDIFLKSTRMEVEKTTLPDIIQQQVPKKPEKFVAKAVKHLPKSEQIEYKNLVKRMAELEKMKQARQMNLNMNKALVQMKDTLKPRNVESKNLSANNHLEQQIQISRKNIAEESAKMLQLKEEGTKLSQKYKIVVTELRNVRTAIALNKKQQRSVQACLTKIRHHHQMLLKSSMASTHSKINQLPLNPMKLQKENNPGKEDKTQAKIAKVNPIKDVKEKVVPKDKVNTPKDNNVPKDKAMTKDKVPKEKIMKEVKEPLVIHHPRLSVQLDLANNKKVVKMAEENSKDIIENSDKKDSLEHNPEAKGGGTKITQKKSNDDYRSPLDAFGSTTWEADPNAILCPFDVGGDCKDADCKYLHTHRSK